MNVQGIQNVAKAIGKSLNKNSPSILTGLAVAGVVTTTVMAVRATPKALLILQEERERLEGISYKRGDELITSKEAFLLTWKCYAPTAVMGALTVGCIIGANSINLNRNAALAGAYSLAEITLKEYRNKVVETIGQNKEREIRKEVVKERITRNPVNENAVLNTRGGDTLCYDSLSGRYFKSDREYIRSAMNKLSRDLVTDMSMYLTLNDVYSELGLPNIVIGDQLGWNIDDGLIVPEFDSHVTDDGKPCLVLEFATEPRPINLD